MKHYQPTNIMLNFLKRLFLNIKEEVEPIDTYNKYNYRIIESIFNNGTKTYSTEYQVIKFTHSGRIINESKYQKIHSVIGNSFSSYEYAEKQINYHKEMIAKQNKKEIKQIIHEIK